MNTSEMKRLTLPLIGLLAFAAQPLVVNAAVAGEASADEVREYLVTMARPNQLYVIDPEAQEVVRTCDVEGDFGSGTLQLSPDDRIAYVLHNRWEDVVGIDLTSCEEVFRASGSGNSIRAKSIASLAVSPDGSRLYSIWDRVRLGIDHYEVLEPQLAVYDTTAGLAAEPLTTFPAPRQVTTMGAAEDGYLYLAGADIYRLDPESGETEIAIANRNWDRPSFSSPDSLAVWSMGEVTNEFLRPYTVAEHPGEENEAWHWGVSRVDLATGETENKEIVPFEFIIFSMVSDPRERDVFYGVYTQLSKLDARTQEIVDVIDLDHTYYSINTSYDGSRIYLGGASSDIAIYDDDFNDLGRIRLPGDMSTATLKVARF
ncbi:quinohemoprotein amine dehydrogenase subunit beta [Vreelandella titanicae]|uniref:quinohemoprotein amine dehydrogenase subunit beta n=1 Tax=Halomonadaceae TaxID=28256 RepID=UPI00059B19FC|nr:MULTISPECIES: quinohemoprotein amine dehydrogenase subunit beta [unclassified Halomonas]KIN13657.1 quinohemoprotein amine dehydrogenase [Halomonas sp. KHS3]MCD1586121.1 quinohemoprotein amine dehydrogenase subunit beta [Halomonas sp. IOP_14]